MAEFLHEELIIFLEVGPATRFFDVVGEHVGEVEADCSAEAIADSFTVFLANLVGDSTGGIGLKGEVDELEHGSKIVLGIFGGDVELGGDLR